MRGEPTRLALNNGRVLTPPPSLRSREPGVVGAALYDQSS